MPEPVLYMRGLQFLSDRAISEEMLNDLKMVTTVTPEVLDEVATSLAAAEGFLDTSALNSHLRQILPAQDAVAPVRRVVLNIKLEDVSGLLKRLRQAQQDVEEFPLTVADLDSLANLLPRLLKPVPALRRYRKAERLAKTTGQPLEDIQFVCDLRPVFDDSRQTVEGLIPFTRLKIVATGGDGLPNVFEAEISAEQVTEFAEKVQKAVCKLAVLREKGELWAKHGVPNVPLVKLSKTKGTEGGDSD